MRLFCVQQSPVYALRTARAVQQVLLITLIWKHGDALYSRPVTNSNYQPAVMPQPLCNAA